MDFTVFVQVKEEGKPVQSRFLRSQQDLKEKLEQQAANAGDEGDGDNGKSNIVIQKIYRKSTPGSVISRILL